MKALWPVLFFLIFTKSLFAGKIIYFPTDVFPFTSHRASSFVDIKPLMNSFSGDRVSSPPKEYFSINTVYLRNQYLVHMGKDLINGTYVVMPSPNILSVEPRPNGKKAVKIQQYFPDLEEKLLQLFALTPSQIHHLYVTSYRVIDQYGKEVESIHIPANVHYRPPMTLTFEVDEKVRVLSFIFSFTSRTAWADSGIGSDLTSIYKDLREMNIDRDARLYLKIDPENSSEIYEVYNSDESQKINQILSELHQVIIWGDMPNRDEVLKELLDLKTFQFVSIDLKNVAAELAKYPHLFGNPTDPRWISKFEKLSTEKYREDEVTNEDSGSLSLGVSGLFDFGGSGSSKTHKRLKEIFSFDMEGEFYIPKAIKFALRADNSVTMLKTLTFQAYKNLEEKDYYLGVGVEVKNSKEAAVTLSPVTKTEWVNGFDRPVTYECPENQFLTGVKSRHNNGPEDRIFGYECSEGKLFSQTLGRKACTEHKNVNKTDQPVKFSCGENKVLISEKSKHHNSPEDRVFSYSCCELSHPYVELEVNSCSWSPFVNGYDAFFHYQCPENMALAGVESHHRNGIEDRRFRYQCCRVNEKK